MESNRERRPEDQMGDFFLNGVLFYLWNTASESIV